LLSFFGLGIVLAVGLRVARPATAAPPADRPNIPVDAKPFHAHLVWQEWWWQRKYRLLTTPASSDRQSTPRPPATSR
jgi:hypothetical protein